MFFEKAVKIMVLFCHMELADPSIMIDEDVGLGLGVGDGAAVMGYGFIEQIGICCVLEISNNLPHIWTVEI